MLRLSRISTSFFFPQHAVTRRTVVNTNNRNNSSIHLPPYSLGNNQITKDEKAYLEQVIKSLHVNMIQKNMQSAQSNFSIAIENGVSCPELYYEFLSLYEGQIAKETRNSQFLSGALNYYDSMKRNGVKFDIKLFMRFMNIAKTASTIPFSHIVHNQIQEQPFSKCTKISNS